jgi:hypothetical protein
MHRGKGPGVSPGPFRLRYAERMSSLALWKAAVDDRSGFLEGIIDLLEENRVRYCAIGGVAVNAYAAPVFTEDLALVVTNWTA